ncbi:MAG TPA: formate dehydrogenase subunit gamma [Dokdonella sp.]
MKPAQAMPAPRAEALPDEQAAAVRAACASHRDRPGALLPVLHAVQHALGCVPPAAIALVAQELNLSRAEVHGVASFYHHFRESPPGRHVVRICRAEACQARGARTLEAHAKHALGIDFGATSDDGAVTLEPAYCLGNCGSGPAILVDDAELHANVTPARFDALLVQWRGVAP